jgi:hypothetical protein
MDESRGADSTGLDVRITNGVMHFSHTGASYVMHKR